MKIYTLILSGLISISTFSQSTLTGKWFANSSFEPQQIEFKSDKTVLISTHLIDGTISVTEGYYHYEEGNDLLVIITWHNNQACTNKFRYKSSEENMTLSQFYPINEEGDYYKGQSLADL
jgi:hypothetical protein